MFTHDRGYVNARSSLTPLAHPELAFARNPRFDSTTLSSLHFVNRFIRACYKSASIEIVVISASSISYDATDTEKCTLCQLSCYEKTEFDSRISYTCQ